ncbi:glycerol kinase [Citrus sinensis]|nr:glycerol kinase [Citrus sinensis]
MPRRWTWNLDSPKVNTNLGFIFFPLGPSEHWAGFRLVVENRTVQWRSNKMVPVQRIPELTRSRQQTASSEGETLDRTLMTTIDTWLIWSLTGGVNGDLHVTDVSNASRTMLMNLKTLDWDKPTLETLGIPAEIRPKIVSNSEIIGKIGKGCPITGIPISGCLGNQHAAMLGQACKKGEAKSTYVQWLRDSLGIISNASEIEELALRVNSTGGIYFVRAFNGLLAPWWRDDARSVCIGITRFTSKAHFARAVLESMCFLVKDVLDSKQKDAVEKGVIKDAKPEFVLRVDGGATVNNLLMQIQADLLGSPVLRPADIESTALGAAFAAGLAIGVFKEEEIFASSERTKTSTTFKPLLNEEFRKKKAESQCRAVERTFNLADLSL